MSVTNRLTSLKTQHEELETRLQTSQQNPATTDADIAELKKQKLALKDEINQLEQQLAV